SIDARADAPPDASPDARIDAAPDATPPCNTLVNAGQNINWIQVTDKLPTPAGGTIVDGTYVLTSQIEYGVMFPGGPIPVGAETIEIHGTTMQVVKADLHAGGTSPQYSTDALTVHDATHVVVQETCPVVNPRVLNGYEATPTTMAFF